MNRDAAQLRDEIALREASLADAQREVAAGELTSEQFDVITRREGAAVDKARRALEELRHADTTTTVQRTRVRRTRLLVVALVCFAVVLGYTLIAATSPRQAGNSVTGNLSLTRSELIARLLSEAEVDVAGGKVVTALSAYQKVLVLEPKNVTALTQSGWLDFSAGSSARKSDVVEAGIKDLEKAIAVAPRQAAPRLYFAIVADSTPGNQHVAKSEFEIFLRLKPSAGQMAIAAPFLKKFGLTPVKK
jgi:tetratricopeptide (TPR) repeat protein